jgi:hypothetical protein
MAEPDREKQQLRVALGEAMATILALGVAIPPRIYNHWRELCQAEGENFHYEAIYLGARLSDESEEIESEETESQHEAPPAPS